MVIEKVFAPQNCRRAEKVACALETECKFLGALFPCAAQRDSMFIETLPKATQRSLAVLGAEKITRQFCIAGGSALALHLGHPISVDLDFFTPRSFDVLNLTRQLKDAGKFSLEQRKRDTLLGTLDGVKISFFRYSYPLIGKRKLF